MNVAVWIAPATSLFSATAILVCYIISSSLNYTEFDFPYVSDTGVNGAGRSVFSLSLNITAATTGILIWLKYKHFVLHRKQYDDRVRFSRLNQLLGAVGAVAVFGIYLLANVQEDVCFPMHFVGAGLGIGLSSLYTFGQGLLSLTSNSDSVYHWMLLALFRVLLAILSTILILVVALCGLFRINESGLTSWPVPVRKLNDWAFDLHLCSSITEWISIFLLFINQATYCWELRHMRLHFNKAVTTDQNAVVVSN